MLENLMAVSEITMHGKGNMQEQKLLYAWLQINRENILLNHAFYLMKWNGLKEEHHFNKIAFKDTKMCIEPHDQRFRCPSCPIAIMLNNVNVLCKKSLAKSILKRRVISNTIMTK